MTQQTYQRLVGGALGAMLGLAYGFSSQAINSLVVPDVPFYQPPWGMVLNIVSYMLIGGLGGLISCWPTSSLAGVAATAILSSIGIVYFSSRYGTPVDSKAVLGVLLALFVLMVFIACLASVFIGLFRWLVNKQVDQRQDRSSLLRRLLVPVTLLLIVGALGITALLPAEGLERVKQMHELVQTGLRVARAADLPTAFTAYADEFTRHASPRYSLQWVATKLTPWQIPQPAGLPEWQLSIVVARFEDGWILACLFDPVGEVPNCKTYDHDPTDPTLNTAPSG